MTAMSPRARRYTSREKAEAIRLRDEGGWNPSEIARIMQSRGFDVHVNSVRCWVDPVHAKRQRERDLAYRRQQRAARSTGRFSGNRYLSIEFKLARIKGLHAAGVPVPSIATVIAFDFPGLVLTASQVRYAVERGRLPVLTGQAS